jgi:general secretion pathway protein J
MRNNRAFTLIELMVALTLLGMVAVLLASGSRLGLDVSARGNAKADALRTDQLERGFLRSQLQAALPLRYWTGDANQRAEHVGFDGEAGRIRFVSRDGVLDGPDNLPRWIDWNLQDGQNRRRKLVVEEHRILSPANTPATAVLARGETVDCNDLRFTFLDTTGEKPQWVTSWTGDNRPAPLPSAVRIQCNDAGSTFGLLVPLAYADSARQGMVVQ